MNWEGIDWTEHHRRPNRYGAVRITEEGFAVPGVYRCGYRPDKSHPPSLTCVFRQRSVVHCADDAPLPRRKPFVSS